MNVADLCEKCEESSSTSVVNGVRVSKRIMPANLGVRGGDWCEAFLVDDDTIALSIGDVCGNGEACFATMTLIRQALRDAICSGCDPSEALSEANMVLYNLASELHATAFCGVLNNRNGTLFFANAGHPVPIVISPTEAGFLPSRPSDIPLGIDPALLPELQQTVMLPHTLMVLYTDGVTDRERKPLCGEIQLLNAARFVHTYSAFPAAFVIEELMFLTGANLDDASILTAWTPGPLPKTTSILRRRGSLNRSRHKHPAASPRSLIVIRPRMDDEIRITLPGRHRWNGSR